MLNARLAEHYGIPGVEGNEFRKVALPAGSQRGGVLTQASVLKVTRTEPASPVLRGKWVLEKILGQPPAPLPPDVRHRAGTFGRNHHPSATRRSIAPSRRAPRATSISTCRASPWKPRSHRWLPTSTARPAGDRRNAAKVAFHTGGRGIYRGPDVELGGETASGHCIPRHR